MRLAAPPTAAKGEHDAEAEQWSRMEQLLAAIKDELQVLRYTYIASKQKKKPRWKPTPTPRPGVKAPRERATLKPEQYDALAAHLARTQGGASSNGYTHN